MVLVSRRKFRGWLLQFHPLLSGGWSRHLWLSAGRGKPLPVGVIGVVHQILFERWCNKHEGDGISLVFPPTYDLQDEEISLRPWCREVLVSSARVWVQLAAGELISPFLTYAPPKRDWRRSRASPGLGTDIGQLLRVYDLVTPRPLPIAVGV